MNREQGVKVAKFDEEIFRKLIQKVKVQSMVEANVRGVPNHAANP
ncbi:hypothetical protein DSOL_4580 [Desulfosporosinus metallidurans]|uniref:Uncharacterized protein n=2 Tax=Desulfosporosinus metallidurans TaxID=1888891 RepID=A0A1Q8QJG3_9FIRM|nr:hypothetical protein DSOL_4580 [Desulfosporosinus metallidurans]